MTFTMVQMQRTQTRGRGVEGADEAAWAELSPSSSEKKPSPLQGISNHMPSPRDPPLCAPSSYGSPQGSGSCPQGLGSCPSGSSPGPRPGQVYPSAATAGQQHHRLPTPLQASSNAASWAGGHGQGQETVGLPGCQPPETVSGAQWDSQGHAAQHSANTPASHQDSLGLEPPQHSVMPGQRSSTLVRHNNGGWQHRRSVSDWRPVTVCEAYRTASDSGRRDGYSSAQYGSQTGEAPYTPSQQVFPAPNSRALGSSVPEAVPHRVQASSMGLQSEQQLRWADAHRSTVRWPAAGCGASEQGTPSGCAPTPAWSADNPCSEEDPGPRAAPGAPSQTSTDQPHWHRAEATSGLSSTFQTAPGPAEHQPNFHRSALRPAHFPSAFWAMHKAHFKQPCD
jgi:hypothetical protein